MKQVETVRVAVRCRPLSQGELNDKRKQIIFVDNQRAEVAILNPKSDQQGPHKSFTFDQAYGPDNTQEQIYVDTAYPIVESVLEGYNGTVFAYGQTGTGKTFTMEGKADPDELRGIIPRAFEQIFYGVEQHPNFQFLIRVSFLEIYNEEVHDLLSKSSKTRLEVKENKDSGFFVKDLSTFVVKGIDEMKEVMMAGQRNRHTGETLMNRDSSRSHSIFQVTLETSEVDSSGLQHYRLGKLNLVDLAGSERQTKTGSTGERLKEATNINKSLLTLGNVIVSLVDGTSTHIPYRDSKLTKLLMDSLGGNTKTVMIANVGPADYNFDETMSTLRYANRAKNIKNRPKINEDPKDMMLREFQDEISRLKAQLAMQGQVLSPEQLSNYGQILQAGEPQIIEKERTIYYEDKEKIQEMEEKLNVEAQMIQEQVEAERKRIEEEKSIAEEERQKYLQELQQKEEEQKKQNENQKKLLRKLKHMEDKLVQGSQMMEQAKRQEQELLRAQRELEMRKNQERELAQEIQKQEEENLNFEQRFSSQQEEIEEKTKKLKKLWNNYQVIQSDIKDIQQEFQREREDLTDTIQILTQQLKLKQLVLDNFIPEEELMRIESIAHWSDELDDWILPRLDLAGNNVKQKRPGSGVKDDVDYDNQVKERMKQAVQNMLPDQDPNMPVSIDKPASVYFIYTDEGAMKEDADPNAQRRARLRSAKRPGTAGKKGKRPGSARPESAAAKRAANQQAEAQNQQQFPKARGLVSASRKRMVQ